MDYSAFIDKYRSGSLAVNVSRKHALPFAERMLTSPQSSNLLGVKHRVAFHKGNRAFLLFAVLPGVGLGESVGILPSNGNAVVRREELLATDNLSPMYKPGNGQIMPDVLPALSETTIL